MSAFQVLLPPINPDSEFEISVPRKKGFFSQPLQVATQVWYLGPGPSPDRWQLKLPFNIDAADTINTNQLWLDGGLGLDLDGSNVTVAIWDSGRVRSTHQEFNSDLGSRVSYGTDIAPISNHATHIAGTLGAEGDKPKARGMADRVKLLSYDFNDDTAEMAAIAADLNLSNHSYGIGGGWQYNLNWSQIGVPSGITTWLGDRALYPMTQPPQEMEDKNFGKYSEVAQTIDQILYDNPNYLTVWAAGNDRRDSFLDTLDDGTYVTFFSSNIGLPGWSGPGWYRVDGDGPVNTVTPPGGDGNGGTGYDTLSRGGQVAKNTLVVGAIGDISIDPYSSSDIVMAKFSNWGPTDDGRIKPDVVGNGVSVYSSSGTSNTAYSTLSGTSMATPSVTGTLALLLQHYRHLSNGIDPLSATLKGLAIHTAFDAGNLGPDYEYGWGVVDGVTAANFLTDAKSENPASNLLFEKAYLGFEQTLDIISNGSGPLKVTLVWTDPPGSIHNSATLDQTTPVLVNDLDLWITDSAGNLYRPWTLDPTNPSGSAIKTFKNSIDNVEQVSIETPSPGTYQLHIGSASSFNQNYSLLVSGVSPGVILTQSDGSTEIREAGKTDTYDVVLGTPPSDPVTVTVDPDSQTDLGTGADNPVTLTFSPEDWNIPQTITVTAVNDILAEGPHTSSIAHSVSSSDSHYNGDGVPFLVDGIASQTVTAEITDNDVAYAISATPPDLEEGDSESQPILLTVNRSGVTNQLSSINFSIGGSANNGTDYTGMSDGDEESSVIGPIQFAPDETEKTIALTVKDDEIDEEDETVEVTLLESSPTLGLFTTLLQTTAIAKIIDDDTAGIDLISDLTVLEEGGSGSYTIQLTSQPVAPVTIHFITNDRIQPILPLTFDSTNWKSSQTVTFTAVDNTDAEGELTSEIDYEVISPDPKYDDFVIPVAIVKIVDNDTPTEVTTPTPDPTPVTTSTPDPTPTPTPVTTSTPDPTPTPTPVTTSTPDPTPTPTPVTTSAPDPTPTPTPVTAPTPDPTPTLTPVTTSTPDPTPTPTPVTTSTPDPTPTPTPVTAPTPDPTPVTTLTPDATPISPVREETPVLGSPEILNQNSVSPSLPLIPSNLAEETLAQSPSPSETECFCHSMVLLDPDSVGFSNDPTDSEEFDRAQMGDTGNNTLTGSHLKDSLNGQTGSDFLYGGENSDFLMGGLISNIPVGPDIDSDWLCGNEGSDSLCGNAGQDTLYGGKDNDIAIGGKDEDWIWGEVGDDTLHGGESGDTLEGGDRNDALLGDSGDDWLFGNVGRDSLCGGTGNDTLFGDDRSILAETRESHDWLCGEAGNDFLVGGSGKDTLMGGEGSDRFSLALDSETDTILDFEPGTDYLVLPNPVTFAQLSLTQENQITFIRFVPTGEILALLPGMNASTLRSEDFRSG